MAYQAQHASRTTTASGDSLLASMYSFMGYLKAIPSSFTKTLYLALPSNVKDDLNAVREAYAVGRQHFESRPPKILEDYLREKKNPTISRLLTRNTVRYGVKSEEFDLEETIRDLQENGIEGAKRLWNKSYIIKYSGQGGGRGEWYAGEGSFLYDNKIKFSEFHGTSTGAIDSSMHSKILHYADFAKQFSKLYAFKFSKKLLKALQYGKVKAGIFFGAATQAAARKILGRSILDTTKYDKVLDEEFDSDIFETRPDLFIYAADLKNNERKIFSRETTPDTKISEAVKHSSRIPFLMNGESLGDGGAVPPPLEILARRDPDAIFITLLNFFPEPNSNYHTEGIEGIIDETNGVVGTNIIVGNRDIILSTFSVDPDDFQKWGDKKGLATLNAQDLTSYPFDQFDRKDSQVARLAYTSTQKLFIQQILNPDFVHPDYDAQDHLDHYRELVNGEHRIQTKIH